jgi:predicted kinase
MTSSDLATNPVLIIVNGPLDPAKSTIASVLAERLGLPRFSCDEIREGLFEATSPLTRTAEGQLRKLTAQASELLLAQAAGLLEAGESVLIEGPLQPRVDDARVARLRREFGVRPLQLLVTAALPVLVRRHELRAVRQLAQAPRSQVALRELERSLRNDSRPLDGLPTMRIDTTSLERVDIDDLEARVRAWMLEGSPNGPTEN